jgi:predicted Rossmann-fold nucleotide-binding protein
MVVLIDTCDAAIVLPGGVGTLAEITLMWNRMIVEAVPRRKLIIIGQGWQTTFSHLFNALDGYFPPSHQSMLEFQPTIESAVLALD